jgi:hypothetical protein
MCKDIEFIRKQAKRGHSFSHTASLLGFYPYQLRTLLEAVGADDIEFVYGHRSLAKQRQLADLHASRKDRPQAVKPENLEGLRKGREQMRAKHQRTAFGVTGTLPQLKEHFGCTLHINTLRRRVRQGIPVEEALTRPGEQPPPKGVIPPQFVEQVRLHQQRLRDRRDAAIQRRLTPSMMQFSAKQFDIQVIHREVGCVTVQVRTLAGELLHSLRFYVSFDSGVLFAFNAAERGRLDFIAFEPNSKALIKRST